MTTAAAEELRLASRTIAGGLLQTELSVPGIHCGGCVQRIEKAIGVLGGVETARVNLSTRRLTVRWQDSAEPPPVIEALDKLGFAAHLGEPEQDKRDPVLAGLIRALAVAGFAAGNIMLFSVSVWSGADDATRDLFHWISAGIALAALLYSGRPFYASAWRALRHGRTNMDVPIVIGVSMAYGMSLYDTIHHGPHAYFDAATSLLFFLLIGRTLDHAMREKARGAVTGLARLIPRGANTLDAEGRQHYRPLAEIAAGMILLVPAGERIPVDAEVTAGRSEIDTALVTGEQAPRPAHPGDRLQAGMLNLTAPLTLRALAPARDSFLAEMTRLMEAAEAGRGRYRRIADRASRLYAPAVHLAALLTFAGWMIAGADWHRAADLAVAVLIITCPCALGLAVPMVQVCAARRLFDQGVMVKDGGALERLAEIDHVAFDKTGTLTLGTPAWIETAQASPYLDLAASLAAHSSHPRSRALARAGGPLLPFADLTEEPGLGISGRLGAEFYRLGRIEPDGGTGLFRDGALLAEFRFTDQLRPGAEAGVSGFALPAEILSGDRSEAVRPLAERLGIGEWRAGLTPADKVARLEELAGRGHKVLMAGDGINDAPALMAAHVSFAPAEAAEIGRNAADFVFLRGDLGALPATWKLCRNAARLVRQNFALAIGYNALALPLAVCGYVSPLVAALAMSLSS
ncbi:MAG: heavy metal translocating P-type ATPase, partial [Paucibacter sp.]|nr:heavy metal translocating P-type ATPase [Roseateles sp.]